MKYEHALKQELYQELCADKGFTFEILDADEYLIRISDGDRFFVTTFYGWPPLNKENTHRIAKDKVFTKHLLEDAGIPTPRGSHFFVNTKLGWEPTHNKREDAYAYAEVLGYPVFVKPHNLSRGIGAQVCENQAALTHALDAISEHTHVAIVEEVVTGREGRLFCIDGVVSFMYYKEADPDTQIANLAAGGVLVDFKTDDIPTALVDIGSRVYTAFGGDLRVYALDFFERPDGSYIVLEVNGQPFLSSITKAGYRDTARAVLEECLDRYFENA